MLTSISIPYQVFEIASRLEVDNMAIMLTFIKKYAYEGVEPTHFRDEQLEEAFLRIKTILDPIISRAKKAQQRAEERRRFKEEHPKEYIAQQRQKKINSVKRRINFADYEFEKLAAIVHALIPNDDKLCYEILYNEYIRRKPSIVEEGKQYRLCYDPYGWNRTTFRYIPAGSPQGKSSAAGLSQGKS